MITIRFANKKLEKAFLELKAGTKLWGDVVAKKYIERVNALQAVNDVSEFGKSFPHYRDHDLKGPRAGLRAFTLHDRWRLEYWPDADGKGAVIEEVSNHYGD
ncbi:MAG: plasmid maintenance system killer [Armatimonadetes bacterium]|nr:plasmid maintenance system killer [Armatimonadota bacterium]